MKKILTLFTALILFGSMTVKATDYYAAGIGGNWSTTEDANKMLFESGTVYYKTFSALAAASYQFKVSTYNWEQDWGGSAKDNTLSNVELSGEGTANISFTLTTVSDVTIYFDNSSEKVYVQATPASVPSFTFPAGTTIYYDFRTYGSGVNLYNSDWDNVWKADVSAIISCTLSSAWEITATSSLFRSDASGWEIVACATLPTEGQNMLVSENGFDCHWDTYVPPVTPPTVEVKGGWNSWGAALEFVPDGGGLTATATLTGLSAGNYDFKLIIGGDWRSNNNAFHRFWTSASGITENLDNMQLQADADGDYVFTWTYATNAIEITFPSTPKEGTNEVKFFAPRTEEHHWDNVYVYAWRRAASEAENVPLLGDWPGTPATKDGEWYKVTVAKGACVIFHDNNGMQSFDIENVQKDACYVANEIVDGDPIKAKFTESCTVNYFVTGDEGIMGTGNAWNASLPERQLNGSNQITLSALPAGIYEFKLTNGSWAWSLGGQEHLNNACSTLAATTGNGNVKFKIESAQDVTISYDPATQKICLDATTVLPYEDVRTGLTDGKYYTVCYNREMRQIRGASLWSFIGKDTEFAYIVQESAPFTAGKPFILFAESDKLEAVLDGTAVEASAIVANGALHGTFSLMNQAALDAAGDNIYLIIDNELRRVDGQTGNSLPAYRAYVDLDEIGPAPANMPAHVRKMPMHADAAQGFENIENSDKPTKVVIDRTLYILRGENVYDATGRMVK